ncbi:hypothetical protein D3C75_1099020 [compost metagenome]
MLYSYSVAFFPGAEKRRREEPRLRLGTEAASRANKKEERSVSSLAADTRLFIRFFGSTLGVFAYVLHGDFVREFSIVLGSPFAFAVFGHGNHLLAIRIMRFVWWFYVMRYANFRISLSFMINLILR